MANGRAIGRRDNLIAAARAVFAREGVQGATLRAVAAEAEVPLATLQYVFPSKELLLEAVIVDVRDEIEMMLRGAGDGAGGLGDALRRGMLHYWQFVVIDHPELPLLHHELFVHAVRTPGLQHLARKQMEGYSRIVAWWCQRAANDAGELCSVPFGTLGRVFVGSLIGTVVEYLSDEDQARSQEDLEWVISMLTDLAGVTPARD